MFVDPQRVLRPLSARRAMFVDLGVSRVRPPSGGGMFVDLGVSRVRPPSGGAMFVDLGVSRVRPPSGGPCL